MKKRILPLLLTLCLTAGLLALPAVAEETDEVVTEEVAEVVAEETDETADADETAEAAADVVTEPEQEPETEPEPEPQALALRVIEQRVHIDNGEIPYGFYMCALVDQEGKATTYVRVRDLAAALLDTPAEFGVTWDGQVKLTRGGESDLSGTGGDAGVYTYAHDYEIINEATLVNGRTVTLEGIRFTDSKGGGHTYYKLRDLGEALDFNVGWSGARGIYIETDKPYDPGN